MGSSLRLLLLLFAAAIVPAAVGQEGDNPQGEPAQPPPPTATASAVVCTCFLWQCTCDDGPPPCSTFYLYPDLCQASGRCHWCPSSPGRNPCLDSSQPCASCGDLGLDDCLQSVGCNYCGFSQVCQDIPTFNSQCGKCSDYTVETDCPSNRCLWCEGACGEPVSECGAAVFESQFDDVAYDYNSNTLSSGGQEFGLNENEVEKVKPSKEKTKSECKQKFDSGDRAEAFACLAMTAWKNSDTGSTFVNYWEKAKEVRDDVKGAYNDLVELWNMDVTEQLPEYDRRRADPAVVPSGLVLVWRATNASAPGTVAMRRVNNTIHVALQREGEVLGRLGFSLTDSSGITETSSGPRNVTMFMAFDEVPMPSPGAPAPRASFIGVAAAASLSILASWLVRF